MNLWESAGRLLVIAGLCLAVIGGAVWAVGHFGGLQNLPGTIRFGGRDFVFVFPLLACVVISLVLTVLINVIMRLLH